MHHARHEDSIDIALFDEFAGAKLERQSGLTNPRERRILEILRDTLRSLRAVKPISPSHESAAEGGEGASEENARAASRYENEKTMHATASVEVRPK